MVFFFFKSPLLLFFLFLFSKKCETAELGPYQVGVQSRVFVFIYGVTVKSMASSIRCQLEVFEQEERLQVWQNDNVWEKEKCRVMSKAKNQLQVFSETRRSTSKG